MHPVHSATTTHKRVSLVAGSVVLSLIVVLLLAAAVGGAGLLLDAEVLWGRDYLSIKDCVIDEDRGRAISLFWVQPTAVPNGRHQVGMHSLDAGRAVVVSPWLDLKPTSMAAAPEGDRLFLGTPHGEIYSASFAQPDVAPKLLVQHADKEVSFVACSPDGRTLLALGPTSLCAYSVDSQALKWQRVGVHRFAIDPHSQGVACSMRDGQIVELDADSGREIRSLGQIGWTVQELVFSSNGRRMVCVGDNAQLVMFDWPRAERLWKSPDLRPRAGAPRLASFSPSGKLLVTSGEEDVRNLAIWSVETGERLGEICGHRKAVTGAVFADERKLFSWSNDGTIRTWDLERQETLQVTTLSISS